MTHIKRKIHTKVWILCLRENRKFTFVFASEQKITAMSRAFFIYRSAVRWMPQAIQIIGAAKLHLKDAIYNFGHDWITSSASNPVFPTHRPCASDWSKLPRLCTLRRAKRVARKARCRRQAPKFVHLSTQILQ